MKQVIITTERLNSFKKGDIINYGTANENLNIQVETLIRNGEAKFVKEKEEKEEVKKEIKGAKKIKK